MLSNKNTALSLIDANLLFLLNRPKTKILKDKGDLLSNVIKTKDEVHKHWNKANYNIALLTGANNIIVIDVDDKDGKGKSLKELERKYKLPKTLTVKSPTGQGRHYYYYSKEYSNMQSLNAEQTAVKGVEIITGNKQITFANSIVENINGYGIPSDAVYKVIDAFNDNVDVISRDSIANLTGDALLFIQDSYNKSHNKTTQNTDKEYRANIKKLASDLVQYLDNLPDIDTGKRNETLFKIGVQLKYYGVSDNEVDSLLYKINEEKCTTPLNDIEVKGIIKSIINRNIRPIPKLLQNEITRLQKDGEDTEKLLQRQETYTEMFKDKFNIDNITNPDMFTYNQTTGDITGVIELELIREIIKDRDFIKYNQMIWYYNNGKYIIDEDNYYLRKTIEKMIPAKFVTAGFVNDVKNSLLQTLEIARDDNTINNHSDNIINFKNGMYDVLNFKLLEHRKEYNSINQINVDIDLNLIEKVKKEKLNICPNIKTFLTEITDDEDDIDMLLEYLSTAFTKTRKVKNLLWIYGGTNTGKSTLTRFITDMLGVDNVSHIPLDELNSDRGKFSIQKIQNKTLNISSEGSKNAISYTNYIKQLTGDDTIKGEYKGGKIFFFSPYAKLLIAGNELPTGIKDNMDAFINRLRILETNYSEVIEKIDNLDEILKSERREFVSYLMYVLNLVINKDYKIKESYTSTILKNTINETKDTVTLFIELVLEKTNNTKDVIKQNDLYQVFCEYALDTKENESISKREFYSALSDNLITNVRRSDGEYRRKVVFNYAIVAFRDDLPHTQAILDEMRTKYKEK